MTEKRAQNSHFGIVQRTGKREREPGALFRATALGKLAQMVVRNVGFGALLVRQQEKRNGRILLDVIRCFGFRKIGNHPAEPPDQMHRAFFENPVRGKRPTVLQSHATENEALLFSRHVFDFRDFLLEFLCRRRRFHIHIDRLARQRLDKDLHDDPWTRRSTLVSTTCVEKKNSDPICVYSILMDVVADMLRMAVLLTAVLRMVVSVHLDSTTVDFRRHWFA